ncbi:MAG: hypothetical protein E6G79_06150 [Alphaproteobacteria bacterium]|nr:MAG: hypothetical protein E6G79_06150 [Alphaproteobacteria bacterium]
MRVVEVRASRTIRMRLIGDMREWLDQNGGTAVHLSVEREGAVGIVTIQFDTDDDLAEHFRNAFRGSYID